MQKLKYSSAFRYEDNANQSDLVEIRRCSCCKTRLGVPEVMLGSMLACPECQYVCRAITAIPFGQKPTAPILEVIVEEEIIELRPAVMDVA